MGIKETPIGIKTYYKSMKEYYKEDLENNKSLYNTIMTSCNSLYFDIKSNIEIYKEYNIDLMRYKEFVENKYIDGTLYKIAKGAFINRTNDYTLVSCLYDLYQLVKLQKQIVDITNTIDFDTILTNLTLKQYTEILRSYYTQVHKKLIIEGNGYVFGEDIGWICINRVLINSHLIDYKATKEKEKELKAAGKRIYNKEEAEWCKRNGIEYKAEDKRVFKTNEFFYEIPLISSKLPGGNRLKLTISDYRHKSCRGKTNEKLIEECGGDINKICELSIDLKTKVTLCDLANKILYNKFIRNENQESIKTRKINRKNR